MNNLIKIYDQDSFGRGVGKLDDKIVFVKNALIDEEVEINIKIDKKSYIEAEASTIIKKSIERKEYECKYYNICGGCDIGHQKYEYQLKFKKNKVIKSLEKIAKLKDIKINEIYKSEEFFYRNKIVLRIHDEKIGFFEKHTNKIVDIDSCIIGNKTINETIQKIKEFICKHPNNNIEKIFIRSDSETMIGIYSKNFKMKDSFINHMKNIANSILLNDKVIYNNDFITMTILNYKFQTSINSFFQINKNQTEKMYETIKNNCKKNSNLAVDLYCGVGTIGITISEMFNKVIGIELEPTAVKNAFENKILNKINNIDFIEGKVENLFEKITEEIDTLIIDPPRGGLDKKTLSQIILKEPKQILYVSCNIDTMSRDLIELKEHYEIKKVYLFDMFPNTHHIETLMVLEKI